MLLAFVPFLFWALGDFLIQRSTRVIGTSKTLFIIGIISTPLLLPFIYKDLLSLTLNEHIKLLLMSVLVLTYSIVLFKAFKVGKLSVVESIVVLELPIAVAMAMTLLGESLSVTQVCLFLVVCVGVALAAVKDVRHLHYHKHLVEKGVWLALLAAILGAIIDIFISHSSQVISPLVTIWYQHAFIAFVLAIYLTLSKAWKSLYADIKTHPYIVLGQGIADNIAWIGYAFAVTVASTSLVLTISEGYIILAALLGHYFNKEKLKKHQAFGAALAIPAMLILVFISE